ncbi:MAG: hypothetical protein LUF00_03500 [Lachnospiraceae bacterium]|nr:hypothetical protein [Lachnospiraceae bacterium]
MNEDKPKKQNPLGTQPLRELIPHYAIPATIALVVNALYNIVDQIFIGQSVGYLGNTATNIINPLMIIMLGVATLWGDGCASYTSLQQGKGHQENVSGGKTRTGSGFIIWHIQNNVGCCQISKNRLLYLGKQFTA